MANEKRLIDANALIEFIKRTCCEGCNSYEGVRCRACEHDDEMLMLEEAPTVDAVEVVHGRWIYKWDAERDPKKYFIRIVCSECNLHTGQRSNYCPQCGAKMDGDGNG